MVKNGFSLQSTLLNVDENDHLAIHQEVNGEWT